MGKSTAADLLRKRGLLVVDSDVIARQAVEPGQPALAEIRQLFGAEMVGDDGRLRGLDRRSVGGPRSAARSDHSVSRNFPPVFIASSTLGNSPDAAPNHAAPPPSAANARDTL